MSEKEEKKDAKEEVLVEDKKDNEDSIFFKKINDKTYLNLYCCNINVGLVCTYIYITISASLNVINRILFQNYNFHFNFTLSFAQQFFCFLAYILLGHNETFKKQAGEISFADFLKNKYWYFLFAFVFGANILFNFYGNQVVKSVNMFLSIRKLNAIVLYGIDAWYGKKKFSCITVSSIFLIVGGAFVIAKGTPESEEERKAKENFLWYEKFLGFFLVLLNNICSIGYTKFSEVFREKTNYSNFKLLIYNSRICTPFFIIGIFVTGEHLRLKDYIMENTTEYLIKSFLYVFLSASFVLILTLSFFVSNEKISSLMTNLLNNSRTIFISLSLYIFDSEKNDLNWIIVTGVVMSTLGAIFINAETLIKNLIFNKKDDKKEDKKDNDKNEKEGTELVDVQTEEPKKEDEKK